MTRAATCEEPRCIDGWLYNGIGGMIFPTNKRCACNPEPIKPPVEWQSRVREEKTELDAKLEKLKTFFGTLDYAKLDRGDQVLLVEQRQAMQDYSNILRDRIARFK